MKQKICPRCGSEDIVWIIPQNWSMWSCNNCKYTGAVLEADQKTQDEIKENWPLHKDEILSKENEEKSSDDIDDDLDNLSEEELERKLEELSL